MMACLNGLPLTAMPTDRDCGVGHFPCGAPQSGGPSSEVAWSHAQLHPDTEGMRHIAGFIVIALCSAFAQDRPERQNPLLPNELRDECAAAVAHVVGVHDWMEQLRALRSADEGTSNPSPRMLLLGQRIVARMIRANVQIDSALSHIDNERAQVQAIRDFVSAQNQQAQRLTNIANLIGGTGVGVVGSSLSFSDDTKTLGSVISLASSVASLGISVFKKFRSESVQPPERLTPDFPATMLEGITSDSDEPPVGYPEIVWAYLNSRTCSSLDVTWRKQLLKEWAALNRRSSSTPTEGDIAKLTTDLTSERRFASGTLKDRARMLANVRARISAMKLVLSELLESVESTLPNP